MSRFSLVPLSWFSVHPRQRLILFLLVILVASRTEGGQLRTYGTGVWREGIIPYPVGPVRAVSTNSSFTAFVREDGTLVFRGNTESINVRDLRELTGVLQVETRRNAILVITEDGALHASGQFEDNSPIDTPGRPTQAVAASLGSNHALALQADGTVVAWGNNAQLRATPPPGLDNVIAVEAGRSHSLALTAAGEVVGWGSNLKGQLNWPLFGAQVVAISAYDEHSAALDSEGNVYTWGWDGKDENPPDNLPPIMGIATGWDHVAAVSTAGEVFAWGPVLFDETEVPPDITPAASIVAGEYHNLAIHPDGSRTSWGQASFGQDLVVPPGIDDFLTIEAGEGYFLGLRSDGSVVAWGLNSAGQCDVPEDLPPVVQIAAGREHALALDNSGNVHAWGRTVAVDLIPEDPPPIQKIAAGTDFTLALDADGGVHLWARSNSTVLDELPGSLPNAVDIAAGWNHCLILTGSGEVISWGRFPDGTALPVQPISNVAEIESGQHYFMVRYHNSGAVRTFYPEFQPQAVRIDDNPSGFNRIKAGRSLAMGWRADGSFEIWGSNSSFYRTAATALGEVQDMAATFAAGAVAFLYDGARSYAEWIEATAPGWSADPPDDPLRNGFPGLLAYALDTSPEEPDRSVLPEISEYRPGRFKLEYREPKYLDGYSLLLERTFDFSTWQDIRDQAFVREESDSSYLWSHLMVDDPRARYRLRVVAD